MCLISGSSPRFPIFETGPSSFFGSTGRSRRSAAPILCELFSSSSPLHACLEPAHSAVRSAGGHDAFNHLTQITNVHETPASSASGRTAPSSGVGHLCPLKLGDLQVDTCGLGGLSSCRATCSLAGSHARFARQRRNSRAERRAKISQIVLATKRRVWERRQRTTALKLRYVVLGSSLLSGTGLSDRGRQGPTRGKGEEVSTKWRAYAPKFSAVLYSASHILSST